MGNETMVYIHNKILVVKKNKFHCWLKGTGSNISKRNNSYPERQMSHVLYYLWVLGLNL